LVSLLPRSLILTHVFLDELGELGRARSHGTFVLLLSVVSLSLSLELLNNLVFLSQLEVHLTKLILQNHVQVRLFLRSSRIFLLLLLLLLLRDQEVVLLDSLELFHSGLLGLFQEILRTGSDLNLCL